MEKFNVWGETIVMIMTTLWGKIAGFIPNLLGAIILLLAGYFIAKSLAFLFKNALKKTGFDRLSKNVGLSGIIEKSNISLSPSDIMGRIVFWIIMLTFLISATEALGLPRITETLDQFLLYLPRVIGSALILLIGLFVAHFVRDLVRSGAEGIGVDYARSLGNTAYGILFVVIASLAIGQLDIDTGLLDTVFAILLAAIGIAAALSLGLGTRDLASNILAGVYARDLYRNGDRIEIEDIAGTLDQIGTVKTRIATADNRVVSIANRVLIEKRVTSSYE